jgi:phosphoketolase
VILGHLGYKLYENFIFQILQGMKQMKKFLKMKKQMLKRRRKESMKKHIEIKKNL